MKRDLIIEQDGMCAICRVDFSTLPTKHVHADHCHATHTPRGILCHRCNLALGKFEDNPELLRRAAAYLEEHSNAVSK